jgi:hypothetical protein
MHNRAKFGLRPAEIVALVEALSARGMINCLQLLHFHAGSQVRFSCFKYRKGAHFWQDSSAYQFFLHRMPNRDMTFKIMVLTVMAYCRKKSLGTTRSMDPWVNNEF